MSNKPFNLCQARAGKDGKTYWNKIGSAWPDDKGGFSVVFGALPIPSFSEKYGLRVEAKLFPPREDSDQRDDSASEYRAAKNGGGSFDQDIGDDIPY